jgi:hypothetical protein
MNYDNVLDGSVDNRKKRCESRKKTSDDREEEVNERNFLTLVMWYLSGIGRLKRLFSSARDAKLMIWHATPDGCKNDGKLWHPKNVRS